MFYSCALLSYLLVVIRYIIYLMFSDSNLLWGHYVVQTYVHAFAVTGFDAVVLVCSLYLTIYLREPEKRRRKRLKSVNVLPKSLVIFCAAWRYVTSDVSYQFFCGMICWRVQCSQDHSIELSSLSCVAGNYWIFYLGGKQTTIWGKLRVQVLVLRFLQINDTIGCCHSMSPALMAPELL